MLPKTMSGSTSISNRILTFKFVVFVSTCLYCACNAVCSAGDKKRCLASKDKGCPYAKWCASHQLGAMSSTKTNLGSEFGFVNHTYQSVSSLSFINIWF